MNRTLCLAAIAASAVAACDGQVDTHYRGEPLMTLSGDVIADGPLEGDLEPSFVFRKQQDDVDFSDLILPTGTQTNVFMRGQVTGSFPNAFTMTLFDAPPASVLYQRFRGEALVALGDFVAVPRDHPNQLTTGSRKVPNPEAGPEAPSFLRQVQLCSETGDCIEKTFPCSDEPTADANFPCGPRIPDRPAWETWCYSTTHHILYAAEAVPAGSYTARFFNGGKALAPGYYLIAIEVPRDRTDPDNAPPLSQEDAACSKQRDDELHARAMELGIDLQTDTKGYGDLLSRMWVDHPCAFDPKLSIAPSMQSVKLTLTTAPWDPWLSF